MEKDLIIKEKIENIYFDYSKVDEETGNMMKQAVETMTLVTKNTKFVMGEQLSKVQEKLAGNNQYDSFFGKWFSALGLKKDFVYDCINYYKVLVANSDNQIIQSLQFSKVCEVAKLKDTPELQKKVIEIAPIKDMRIKEIKALVEEVKEKQEVTEEMIEAIIEKEDKSKSSINNFLKASNTFIETLENQGQEMNQKEIEKVLELLKKLNDLCKVTKIEK